MAERKKLSQFMEEDVTGQDFLIFVKPDGSDRKSKASVLTTESDERLDTLETRADGVDTRLDGVDETLGTLDTVTTSLLDGQEQINSELSALQTQTGKQQTSIEALQTQVSSQLASINLAWYTIGEHETRLNGVDESLGTLGGIVTSLLESQAATDTSIGDLTQAAGGEPMSYSDFRLATHTKSAIRVTNGYAIYKADETGSDDGATILRAMDGKRYRIMSVEAWMNQVMKALEIWNI